MPSARRRLQANFSGVIAFDFSTDVVANSFWESRNKKTYRDLVSCTNGSKWRKKHILLRNKVINNRDSLEQIVIEKVSVLVCIDFS